MVNSRMDLLISTFWGTITQVCFVQALQLDMPSIGNIWAQPEVGERGEERRAKEIYGGQSPWSRVACLLHAVYGIHILSDHCYHLARTYYVPGPVLSISQTLSLLTFSATPQVLLSVGQSKANR